MKTLAPTYTISGSTVTLTGVNVPLSQILLIADATTGSVLYSIGGPAPTAYTQGTDSQITLATAPGSSDKLTIYYDNGTNPTNAPSTVTLGSGSANIGNVSLTGGTVTLGSGSASIGTVGVSSLPALPAGSNSIGSVVNNGGTVALSAGSSSIGSINNTGAQFSKISISSVTIIRPANTTAYSANAVINSSTSGASNVQFSSVLPIQGADGYIVAVRALTNVSAFATALRLHFFKTVPTASVNDAAQFTLLNTDFAARVGYVDLSGWTTGGTGSDSAVCFGSFPGSGSSIPIELDGSSAALYAILETRAAFTPTSSQQFKISLKTQLA